MASKTVQTEPEKAEVIEEALDTIETAIDRVKALYEQYFLGIQKQPPSYLHLEVERKLRDLSQIQIRNTAQRYRFVTLQQKFGAYHAYWRRTLRQIENGTYARSLSKVGRKAAMTGEEIPEEILAAMPKRMRAQVSRDREAVLARLRRQGHGQVDETDLLTLAPEPAHADAPDTIKQQPVLDPRGAYFLDESDSVDLEALFAEATADDDEITGSGPPPVAPPVSPPRPAAPGPVRAAGLGINVRTPSPVAQQQRPGQPAPGQPARPNPGQPGQPGQPAPRPDSGQTPPSGPSGQAGQPPPRQPAVPGAPRPGQRPAPPMPPPGARTPPPTMAPSQVTRPNPIAAGASTARPVVPVETMAGPFPRAPAAQPASPPARPAPRNEPTADGTPMRPPPGMTDADVNALYAKYVKAKEMVGETAGPGAYGKLLKTINAQAPKIMEQYKAKAVDFSVVVKDNQVVIRAKPKT